MEAWTRSHRAKAILSFSFLLFSYRSLTALSARPHIVVATPGRLAELLSLGALSVSKLRWLVLDEADRLLSLGFEDQLKIIIAACPAKRQTMLFSATMSSTIAVLFV